MARDTNGSRKSLASPGGRRGTSRPDERGHGWSNQIVGYDLVEPDQLLANPSNYRAHPGRQRDALRGSLDELGWIAPVIVNQRNGHLIDGHARAEEALTKGCQVPVAYVDLTPEKEALALLSLDPISAMAVADADALDALLQEVHTNDEGLQAMLADLAKDAGLYLDAAKEQDRESMAPVDKAALLQAKWGTEAGQIWQAGSHRIMCGDATSEADTEALFGGHRANLVVTDPPYGISYESETSGSIANDDRRDDALVELLKGSLALAAKHSTPEAAFYIWHPSSTRRDFEWAMEAAGLKERQYITWVKSTFTLGRSDYQWQAELCFYAEKAGQRCAYHGDRTEATAWFVDVPVGGRRHGRLGRERPAAPGRPRQRDRDHPPGRPGQETARPAVEAGRTGPGRQDPHLHRPVAGAPRQSRVPAPDSEADRAGREGHPELQPAGGAGL